MSKNVLITGAAKRLGATCARALHRDGHNIVLHYRTAKSEALQLATELNRARPDSIKIIQADLLIEAELSALAQQAEAAWGSLDILVNNAATFYPQPIAAVSEQDWDSVLGSNLKAPFFLAQKLTDTLAANQGCIINIIDIYADRGLLGYPVYSIAKAGLVAMTKTLAKELAPKIRVNGISPGAILWPDSPVSAQYKADIVQKVALKRAGCPADIAKAVQFLATQAPYITGQIITVDGGRTLAW